MQSKPQDESEIQWATVLQTETFTHLSQLILQQRWKRVSKAYIKKHGEPAKFKKLLKGMLEEMKNMPDKGKKKTFKSAEFVDSEEEEDFIDLEAEENEQELPEV
jgi:hypothetical protein